MFIIAHLRWTKSVILCLPKPKASTLANATGQTSQHHYPTTFLPTHLPQPPQPYIDPRSSLVWRAPTTPRPRFILELATASERLPRRGRLLRFRWWRWQLRRGLAELFRPIERTSRSGRSGRYIAQTRELQEGDGVYGASPICVGFGWLWGAGAGAARADGSSGRYEWW